MKLDKRTLSIFEFSDVAPPTTVSAITADQNGFVTVTWGSFREGISAFIILGPDGFSQGDGGGAEYLLNTVQALLPGTLP